jgi:hypothetical protein
MGPTEYQPRERSPRSGEYEELNIFGNPTGRTALVMGDEELPPACRGFSWRPLPERTPAELRRYAREYRRMAEAPATAFVGDRLRSLAERFDALADQREREDRGQP